MNRTITAALIALSIISGNALAQQGEGKHNMQAMMSHANPLPNLMRVIKHQGDQLNLTEEQSKALAGWSDAHHKPMRAKVKEVHDLEKAMFDATTAGKSKAEIMGMASRLMQVRQRIISTKLDCRNNMRGILTEEQFAQVISLSSGS